MTPFARPPRCDILTDAGDVVMQNVSAEGCDEWFHVNDPGYEAHTHRRLSVSAVEESKPLSRDSQ